MEESKDHNVKIGTDFVTIYGRVADKPDPKSACLSIDPSVYIEKGNYAIPEQRNWRITDACFINKVDD